MVIGIATVRDEADIIADTITHMLTQVDHLIVADNLSTDGTREILESFDIEVTEDDQPAYYQSDKMTWLAARAATQGADWVVPFDADEFWYSKKGRIADVLGDQPASISEALNYNHVATSTDIGDSPVKRMGWRYREALPMIKVACRPLTNLPVRIHVGNHDAGYGHREGGLLAIRHYPYRSPEQFVRKIANGAKALKLTEFPDYIGQHWRDYGKLLDAHGPEALHEVFYEHFYVKAPHQHPALVYDPLCTQKL